MAPKKNQLRKENIPMGKSKLNIFAEQRKKCFFCSSRQQIEIDIEKKAAKATRKALKQTEGCKANW